MLKKLICGAMIFGAGLGLFANPKFSEKQSKNFEVAYTIKVPGAKLENGNYSPARVYPVYRLPNDKILPNVIKIKTKKLENVLYGNKGFDNSTLQFDLAKLNIENIRAPYHKFFEETQIEDKYALKNVYEIKINSNMDIYDVCRMLMNNPDIEYASPIEVPQIFDYEVNDPLTNNQYMIEALKLKKAWDISKGSKEIKIAIVDTGVDYDHSDLKPQMWFNPNDINGDQRDNDKNGKVDDYLGWDFVGYMQTPGTFLEDNDPKVNPAPASSDDARSHGTHVAGCAAAATDNGKGIASPGYNCTIIPIKCGADNPVYGRGVYKGYEGILYAAKLGADIINCSWGGGSYSADEEDVIKQATEMGALVVAAAGNSSSDNDMFPTFPASYKRVMTIGALNKQNNPAYFSNYGSTVCSFVPGDSIYASLPGGSFANMSGTSMASPIASGVAALVNNLHRDWTPQQIMKQIRVCSDSFPTFNPKYFTKANAYKAVNYNQSFTSGTTMPGFTITEVQISGSDYITNYNPKTVSVKIKNILGNASQVKVAFLPADESVKIITDPTTFNNVVNNQEETLNFQVSLTKAYPWYYGSARIYAYFYNSNGYRDVEPIDIPVYMQTNNNKTTAYISQAEGSLRAMCGDLDNAYFSASIDYFGNIYQMFGMVTENGLEYQTMLFDYGYTALALNPDQTKLFAGATSNNGNAFIYSSSNSGSNWTLNQDVSSNMTSVTDFFFFTDNYVAAVGDGLDTKFGAFSSTNGGTKWTKNVYVPSVLDGEKANAGSGASWGDYGWFGTSKGRVIYTTNGGTSWTSTNVAEADSIISIAFISENDGLLISAPTNSASPYKLYSSKNSGKTWTFKSQLNNTAFAPIKLLATTDFIALCKNSSVMRSKDSGATWFSELSTYGGATQKGYGLFIDNQFYRVWMGGQSFGFLDIDLKAGTSSVFESFKTADNNLIISPNPATDLVKMNIELNSAKVFIFNTNGKLVLSLDNYSDSQIDISNLSNGFYTVGVIQNGKASIGSLIIIR